MNALITWPWNPPPAAGVVGNAFRAGQEALHHAYLSGFKDGLLLAATLFSILLVLFRRD